MILLSLYGCMLMCLVPPVKPPPPVDTGSFDVPMYGTVGTADVDTDGVTLTYDDEEGRTWRVRWRRVP